MATANTRRKESKDSIDLYTTPPVAINSLIQNEMIEGTILEPCCGMGHISKTLEAYFGEEIVRSIDLYDWGYGETGVDFFKEPDNSVDTIIMNPPYNQALDFTTKALRVARSKVCSLVRINFLETESRRKLFDIYPPDKVYAFSKRIKCLKDGKDDGMSSAVFYCWVVWDIKYRTKIGETKFIWI